MSHQKIIRLRVPAADLDQYDPSRFDARDNGDGTFTLIPLAWHDEASYAAYQGDPHASEPPPVVSLRDAARSALHLLERHQSDLPCAALVVIAELRCALGLDHYPDDLMVDLAEAAGIRPDDTPF